MMKISTTSALVRFIPLCGVILFLFSKSGLLHGHSGLNHIDSEVYIYTASQWLEGKVIYKEVFDHKGPVLYLINMLGLFLFYKNPFGIWIIQMLLILVTLFPLFKQILQRIGWVGCTASILFYISWMYRYLSIGDNTPELYAVGFLSLSLGMYLKFYLEQKVTFLSSFLFGFAAICTLFLKLNFAILLLPLSLFALHECYKQGATLSFLWNSTLGAMLVFTPLLVYLLLHDALSFAYKAMWEFNLHYIASYPLSWLESIKEVILSQKNYFLWFVLLIIPSKLLLTTQKKSIGFLVLLTFLFAIYVLVGIPGRGIESRHYMLPLAPFVALLVFWILHKLKDYVSILFLLLSLYFLKPMVQDVWSQKSKKMIELPEVTFLRKVSKSDTKLFVMGNFSSLYRLTDLSSPSRFFYTFPILQNCNSQISKDAIHELLEQPSQIICVEKSVHHASCLTQLITGYQLAYTGNYFKIYEKK